MITHAIAHISRAIRYLITSPQLVFALLLIVILPLAFLYTANQFLEVGEANQDSLQRARIGVVQDVFSSLILSDTNLATIQTQIERVTALNPDITDFRIIAQEGAEYEVIAALHTELIGTTDVNTDQFLTAGVAGDESISLEYYDNGVRNWQTIRAVLPDDGSRQFIVTNQSFALVDAAFAARKQRAYIVLGIIYILVLIIAFWHIKSTDYRKLYLDARHANETKDLFTNMIAHELRAPLTAIRGYATMQEEKLDGDLQMYSNRVRLSAERLLTIVNDLLDVARIQSGKLSIERETFDINEIIVAVTDELRISAKEKSIMLDHEVGATSVLVNGDRKRMHQALTNLVSNAIKYTKEGSITLSVTEKRKTVEVRVKDTGMGIDAASQQKLFAPFYRVESDDVSQITGTGLGMWITRQLIELMGGSVAVESIKGVGTHVVMTLSKPTDSQSI